VTDNDAAAGQSQLRSYVLGRLHGAALETFEDRLLTDDGHLDRIEMAEVEIVDEYVRGELPPEEQRLFEDRLATSELLRRKVSFAKALSRTSTRAIAPFTADRGRGAYGWLAAAAALIVTVGALSFLLLRRPSSNTVARQTDSAPAPRTPATPSATAPSVTPAPPTTGTTAAVATPVIATLTLWGAMAREASALPTLEIPAGRHGTVEIRVAIEPGDEYPAYRVTITDSDGTVAFSDGSMRPSSGSGGQTIAVTIPDDRLPAATYRLQLRGARAQAVADLAAYEFRVAR